MRHSLDFSPSSADESTDDRLRIPSPSRRQVIRGVALGRTANGGWIGVPYGSMARLILLYLQTEAIRTNGPEDRGTRASPSATQGRSRMRESCLYGSVRSATEQSGLASFGLIG